jgi:hypothetical protein
VADLKDLTLDADDITAISSCEVGSCNMKLSSAMITRLRGDTKKTPPEQLFREILAEYVRTYLASGNGALVEYRDKPAAVSLGSEFQDMLSTATYLRDYSPEFYAYLQNYPRGKPAGVEDFIYWSKEKFGLKPVISVTHSFIYQRPGTSDVLIISKQIYASHYFDASVGMAGSIAGVPAGSRPYSYVFYFNRSRIDALGGMLGGVANSLIRQQLKDGMVTNLKLARQRLETR